MENFWTEIFPGILALIFLSVIVTQNIYLSNNLKLINEDISAFRRRRRQQLKATLDRLAKTRELKTKPPEENNA
ncbi:MAG: hypothetical protein V3T23_13825 [Nitrososphaerales archaeon]